MPGEMARRIYLYRSFMQARRIQRTALEHRRGTLALRSANVLHEASRAARTLGRGDKAAGS